ncbi:MAG: prephenate dehydratase domain-containing protein, partial [Chitinophagaceae bacterium]
MSIRVSIQGYEGSFHQEAAIHFFGSDIQVIPCAQFSEVVQYVNNQAICDAGVMAIENSIAGSILSNYHLLQQYQLEIVGEIYLGIHQQLLVNPGTSLHDIKEVHSHRMA